MTCPEIPFIVPLKPCPACGPGGDNCNPSQQPGCSWDPSTVVDPVSNPDPNYDPVGYKSVRFIGQMVNTQDSTYVSSNYGVNIGMFLRPDGSIKTTWQPMKIYDNGGNIIDGGFCIGTGYARNNDGYHVYMGRDLQPNPYTDREGTTSYTEPEFRPWRSYIRITTSGLDYGRINTIFAGNMAWVDYDNNNRRYFTNPSSGGVYGTPWFRGGLYAENAAAANKTESLTISGYFEFSFEDLDGDDEPTRPTTTWTGINDDGSCDLPVIPVE